MGSRGRGGISVAQRIRDCCPTVVREIRFLSLLETGLSCAFRPTLALRAGFDRTVRLQNRRSSSWATVPDALGYVDFAAPRLLRMMVGSIAAMSSASRTDRAEIPHRCAAVVVSPSGGEWGLVAPAVFKTVVSARKRRWVGSIPTRLRHSLPTTRELRDVRQEADLSCASLSSRVHRFHRPVERDVVLGIDEDHALRCGA